MTPADAEREQIACVFGLTGGELNSKSRLGHVYSYDGVPEWAASDFDDHNERDYLTVIVAGGGYLSPPRDEIEETEEETWELVQTYGNSGETECPLAQCDAEDQWTENVLTDDGRCCLCEHTPAEGHGYIYIGEGYEAVYRRRLHLDETEEETEEETGQSTIG